MFNFLNNKALINRLKEQLKEEQQARKAAEIRLAEYTSNFKNSKDYLLYKIREDEDILKTTVNQLTLTDQKLQNLLNSVNEIICRISTDGFISYVNESAYHKLGLRADEIIGKKFTDVFDKDNEFGLANKFNEFLNNQSPSYIEYYVNNLHHNNRIWIGQSLSLVKNVDNEAIEINSVLRDISDLKEYEQQLYTNNSRLENLISNLNFGILVEDEHRKIVLVNQIFCSMFGINAMPSDMVGFDCSDSAEQTKHLFKDPEKFVADISEVLTNREKVIDSHLLLRDNKVYSRDYIPVFIDKIYKGHLWLYKDITEQHHTYLAIQNSEEKYRGVMENMELGLMEVDNNNIITKVYERFYTMLGYEPEEMLGKNAIELLLPQNHMEVVTNVVELRKQGLSSAYEIEILNKKGERIWVMVSGAPIKNIKGEIIGSVGIHYNISEHKKTLQQLELAKNDAEQARLAEVNFLANMSHEIRNPINAIIGISNLMYDTELSEQQYDYLETIKYSSEILMNLISGILDINKIDAGGLEINNKETNIIDLTRAIVKTLSYNTQNKNISIIEDIDKNIEYHVYTDLNYFNQILMNLIGNAIKFTEQGFVKVVMKLVSDTDDGYKILMEFIDTGIGIGKEELPGIFDNFKQANMSIRKKFGGTGLGLAITKKLVEAQNAEIFVESELNKGTKFSVLWNFKKAGKIKTKEPLLIKNIEKINVKKALIVEDNIINQNYLKGIFTKNKIDFRLANNGKEAIAICEKEVFDIILMDIRMPEMNGYETTLWIRSQDENANQKTPIIALTASALVDEKAKALEVGMNDHLSKPYTESQLISVINRNFSSANLINVENEIHSELNYHLPEYFDDDLLDKYYLGNLEHMKLVFSSFNAALLKDVLLLRNAYGTNDLAQIKSIVHKIKPNFNIVGFSKLSFTCEKIESSILNTNSLGLTEIQFNNFIEEIESVMGLLEIEIKNLSKG
jgi:PAS domain S-box-containing protein